MQKINTDQRNIYWSIINATSSISWSDFSSPILTELPFPFSELQQYFSLISNIAPTTFAFFYFTIFFSLYLLG